MSAETDEETGTQAVKDPNLFLEAQQLLASLPEPHANPTHSFWLNYDPPFDVKPFETTKIGDQVYDAVIIGMQIAISCLL